MQLLEVFAAEQIIGFADTYDPQLISNWTL